MIDNSLVSGAISGAITDTNSDQALKHAEMYYEEIRHNHSDVKNIAKHTGFSHDQILMVKNFLFVDMHILGDEVKRFSPCFEIAESWRRLAFDEKHIQPHDIILIKHELKEMQLMHQGMSQHDAHIEASKEFNYSKESSLYYKELGLCANEFHDKGQNSGGLSYEDYDVSDDWEERY